jgi:predicted transcriptional regulator
MNMSELEEPPASIPDPNDFESEEADVDERLELRAAFSETLTQHGFPDTLVLARERAEDVFHDRRLDLIDYLKDHDPRSVRALADELGYDKGVVSRDLQKLARIDVVEYVEEGRAKAPRLKHNHVAIEPVV